ncbi:MAG: protein kinase [Acidobacteriota bacterium]|nr:protein kinase [Acidobacteriota bacterium]
MPISPGTNFGRYQIHSQIGAGGMGEVYLAHDAELNRTVALKFLSPDIASDKGRMSRFVQEAKAASALNHPNILTIYEIGQADSARFIVSEFIDGATLRRHMKSHQLKIAEALEVAMQTASALAAAHQAGIVHRDIKPENIMIRPDGYVKVIDFGLAKLKAAAHVNSPDSSTIPFQDTASGAVIGTTDYMSPEQVRGIKADERTDVWSLGVVLYEMIAGRVPFEGQTRSDVLASILERDPPPLVRYSPGAPAELKRIVMKALAKDREERYQTVRDMLIDLKNLKQDLEFEAKLGRSGATDERNSTAVTERVGQQVIDTARESKADRTSRLSGLSGALQLRRIGIAVFTFFVLAGLSFVAFKLLRLDELFPDPQPMRASFAKYETTKIPYLDKAIRIAVSPDGKHIAYVEEENERQSIRIKPLFATSSLQTDHPGVLVAPSDLVYYGLTFSPDGNDVYYLSEEKRDVRTLHRVRVLEGVSRKLIEDIDTPPTISPDGKRLAFVRYYPNKAEDRLIIADAEDGSDEQTLAMRKRPDFISTAGGPMWSPDGEVIACVVGNTTTGSYRSVIAVRVKDGTETIVTPPRWRAVGRFDWLKDGSGLMLPAADRWARTSKQIWYVPYPQGEVRQVTADVGDYIGLNLTSDGKTLAAVQSEVVSHFWLAPGGDANRAKKITSGRFGGYSLSLMADGRILYVSQTSGNRDIWVMDADASSQRQLTFDPNSDHSPTVTPDNRYVVFVSNRVGAFNVWRMDADGKNLKQLTGGNDASEPSCSPDGRWVIYSRPDASGKVALWKVSIDGGDSVQLNDKPSVSPLVSPDGKLIACSFWDGEKMAQRVGVLSFEGGAFVKVFDFPRDNIRWAPDSHALTFVEESNDISNIWSQPLDGTAPRQLTHFKEMYIYSYDWSRDGKLLACERGITSRNALIIRDTGQ